METKNSDEIRQAVRSRYGEIAKQKTSGCGCNALSSCCGTSLGPIEKMSQAFGYTKEQVDRAPEGANMGLGCGNPQAIASLKPGETVLDLGSGGGFDCFLAAETVGESGRVIGVDMTADMVSKARKNAEKLGAKNVEFILDVVALQTLPAEIKNDISLISGCVGGTEKIEDIEKTLREAGFRDINIHPKDESRETIREWFPGRNLEDYVASATIEAKKPF